MIAVDRSLELWQLPTHHDAASRRVTGAPVQKSAEKIKTIQLPAFSAPSELDRAAVRQIIWVPWLPGGGWIVLMSSGLYFYRSFCAKEPTAVGLIGGT